jgi:hypothetical protein
MRAQYHWAYARTTLAAAAAGADVKSELSRAEKYAIALSKEGVRHGVALAPSLLASVAAFRGQKKKAIALLEDGERRLRAIDMKMMVASVQWALGFLRGDPGGRQPIEASNPWMREQRIAEPDRFVAMYLPGPWSPPMGEDRALLHTLVQLTVRAVEQILRVTAIERIVCAPKGRLILGGTPGGDLAHVSARQGPVACLSVRDKRSSPRGERNERFGLPELRVPRRSDRRARRRSSHRLLEPSLLRADGLRLRGGPRPSALGLSHTSRGSRAGRGRPHRAEHIAALRSFRELLGHQKR